MSRLKKTLAVLICLVVALSLMAGTAFAKGKVGGGRSSFSSGSKGVTSGKSYSTSTSNYSSKPAASSTTQSAAPAGSEAAPGGTTGNSPSSGTSYGKGYSTGTGDYSTPREGNPPAMYQDYQTGKTSYSTGQGSYATNRQSYNGTWDRSVSPGSDLYPTKQPVGIFGSPPREPYYYNNHYWGMPWWSRAFFQPNYYYTPWGYHFFAPRILTWLICLGLLGGGGYLLYRYLSRRRL